MSGINKHSLIVFIGLLAWSMFAIADDYGMELDALPWLTGGYYVSGWYGQDQLRYRGVVSHIKVPDSFTREGFSDYDITAYALIADYFPRPDRTGVWYGAGLEYWQSHVRNQADNQTRDFDNTIFTLGLGYVWPLSQSLYLNPWAALHMIIDGERDVEVGNRHYRQDAVLASASIKLGWRF